MWAVWDLLLNFMDYDNCAGIIMLCLLPTALIDYHKSKPHIAILYMTAIWAHRKHHVYGDALYNMLANCANEIVRSYHTYYQYE